MKKSKYSVDYPEFVLQNITELYAERTARGLSLRALSDRTGVPYVSLWNYENLRTWPCPINYNRIARFFNWTCWADPHAHKKNIMNLRRNKKHDRG